MPVGRLAIDPAPRRVIGPGRRGASTRTDSCCCARGRSGSRFFSIASAAATSIGDWRAHPSVRGSPQLRARVTNAREDPLEAILRVGVRLGVSRCVVVLEKPHLRGARARGDELRLDVAAEHSQLIHAAVKPGDAAGLIDTLGIVEMKDLIRRNALPQE